MAAGRPMTSSNPTMCNVNHTESWRLSRIEEELEKVEYSTAGSNIGPVLAGPKAGTLPRRSAQSYQYSDTIEEPINLRYNYAAQGMGTQYYVGSSSTPNLDDADGIYSKAIIKPDYICDKELDRKEAIKFLTGKYDSLGRVRSTMSGMSSPDSLSADLSNGSFGSADFPPPPPEGFGSISPLHSNRSSEQLHPSSSPLKSPSHQFHSRGISQPYPQPQPQPQPQTQLQPQPQHVVVDSFVSDQMDNTQKALLTEQELVQIEMFYRSHKTEVFICQSLVNMYFGSIRNSGSPIKSSLQCESGHWDFYKSGVPVLVLDSGESRRKRKLDIALAERGTGFTLWRDTMNHLSNYMSPQTTFHTLHLSSDHTKLVGFRYVDAAAAADFFHKIMNIISDPNDDILNLSGSRKNKKAKSLLKSKDKKKKKLPSKGDISTPCCFTHITNLDQSEGMNVLGTCKPIQKQKNLRDVSSNPAHTTGTKLLR